MKQNLLKFANSQNPPGKFVFINLWCDLQIGQKVDGYGRTGSEPHGYERDKDAELQQIYIT
jgi:hypothetical protein